jgi:hypothetical protein
VVEIPSTPVTPDQPIVTCDLSIVASPNDSFSTVYSSEPMRKNPRSSSRTAHASTRAREAVPVDVGLHVLAQVRQRVCEPGHGGELLGLTPDAPLRVVEVLEAPTAPATGSRGLSSRIGGGVACAAESSRVPDV